MEKYAPTHRILLGVDGLGKEELLVLVAQCIQSPLLVAEDRLQRLRIVGCPEVCLSLSVHVSLYMCLWDCVSLLAAEDTMQRLRIVGCPEVCLSLSVHVSLYVCLWDCVSLLAAEDTMQCLRIVGCPEVC